MKKLLLIILLFSLTGCSNTVDLSAASDISATALKNKYDNAAEIKSKYILDGASLKKTDIKNPELDKYKGEPKDEVKITIGDKVVGLGAEGDFKPNIELKRWNEVGFKLKTDNLLKDVATKDKKLKFKGDKIKFDTPKISFEMYDFTEGEGGYKYIWYLNEKPATNKIEFEIESEGLDFFYQPALTEEFQNGYSEEFEKDIFVTETQVKDLEGNVLVGRPENVVGSYAVYHSTKGGMNDIHGKEYKAGKAFHIYRPHIIDAEGKETWGILHIENGIYSVEIPRDFLDTAVYPIKSNDEFGYHPSSGGTSVEYTNDNVRINPYAMPANGTVTKLSIFTLEIDDLVTAYLRGVVYNFDTDALVTYGGQVVNPYGNGEQDWLDLDVTDTLLTSGVNYGIGYWGDSTDDTDPNMIWYDSGLTIYRMVLTYHATNAPTDPWSTTVSTADRKLWLYATYTPMAGSTYCGHTGGDWYISTDCWISNSTTTQGTIYITETGSLNCTDNAVISAHGIQGKAGTKINGKNGCQITLDNHL